MLNELKHSRFFDRLSYSVVVDKIKYLGCVLVFGLSVTDYYPMNFQTAEILRKLLSLSFTIISDSSLVSLLRALFFFRDSMIIIEIFFLLNVTISMDFSIFLLPS